LNFIQGTSFQRAKCGDRYWYEFADALFSPGKLVYINVLVIIYLIVFHCFVSIGYEYELFWT